MTIEKLHDKIYKRSKIELNNHFVYIRIDEDGIFARDNTDHYNEESLYTKSKRGIKKAIQSLLLSFDPELNFTKIKILLEENNINFRQYCGMD